MAYLMVKYQEPPEYALMDLSEDEFDVIGRALRELHQLYEGLQAQPDQMQPIEALISMLDRRYEDD